MRKHCGDFRNRRGTTIAHSTYHALLDVKFARFALLDVKFGLTVPAVTIPAFTRIQRTFPCGLADLPV